MKIEANKSSALTFSSHLLMQSKSPPLSLTDIFFGADIDYVPSNNTVIVKSVSILYFYFFSIYKQKMNKQYIEVALERWK